MKMQFERAGLKPMEQVIGAKLVMKLPIAFSASGEVVVYKLVNGAKQELDRTRMPNDSVTWLELSIGPVDMDIELELELTEENAEFLQGLNTNTMLALYTYVEPTQNMPRNIHRRSSSDQDGAFTYTPPNTECSKQTVTLQYSQLQWLGDDVSILSPPDAIDFDFCAGECTFSRDVPLPHQIQEFNKRTRMMEVMNQIGERLTPPPSCIPLTFSTAEIIYVLGDIVNLTTLPTVESCGCRS